MIASPGVARCMLTETFKLLNTIIPSFRRLPFWVKFLTSFNHLMAVANSSTNLALFSVIGTQFRATLLAILHLRKPPQRNAR